MRVGDEQQALWVVEQALQGFGVLLDGDDTGGLVVLVDSGCKEKSGDAGDAAHGELGAAAAFQGVVEVASGFEVGAQHVDGFFQARIGHHGAEAVDQVDVVDVEVVGGLAHELRNLANVVALGQRGLQSRAVVFGQGGRVLDHRVLQELVDGDLPTQGAGQGLQLLEGEGERIAQAVQAVP